MTIANAVRALLVAALAAAVVVPPVASAAPSRKKSMWGPTQLNGQSQFPIYRDLGVGIYQNGFAWQSIAPTRPRNPRDPNDPAYAWSANIDYAIAEARRYGIEVSLLIYGAPRWANGNRDAQWAPKRAQDFADFAYAASKRYPAVRHWMIWGEPSRVANFMPLASPTPPTRDLRPSEKRGPRVYARILDASYVSLKRANRRNVVIGGNTFTTGNIIPGTWIKNLRLPNGKPPRMDLYGHNPFTSRSPDLKRNPVVPGTADISDLDTLGGWIDRYLGKPLRRRKKIGIFMSEFFLPTDHQNSEFNFYVTRETQADWLGKALRITRSSPRYYTLGWFSLYDDPLSGPNGTHGTESHRGLIDNDGVRKPAYDVFKRG